MPSVAQLREAFLWSEHRTVTKTATVNLHGNPYEVDTALVGRRVELVFDPFDLTGIRCASRAGRWAPRSRTGSAATSTTKPAPTTTHPAPRADRDRLPASRRDRSTPPNWPNESATAARCPTGTVHRPASHDPRRLGAARHRPPQRRRRARRRCDRQAAAHYGFTRTPFGRALAPQMLHRHGHHAEAVARIGWCVTERALGVITGEVGAGKTVAVRAALAGLDPSRHTIIYLGNPAVGARGLYHGIVTALGGIPRFHKAALIPQTTDLLAAEEHERGRHVMLVHRRSPPARRRPTRRAASADQRRAGLTPARSPRCWSVSPPCGGESSSAPSPRSTSASRCATP